MRATRVTAPRKPKPDAAPNATIAVPPTRVLVVDDNRDIADVLARMLRRRGHEVDVEYGALAALASARSRQPTVALLDVGLPDMHGFELARRIRADKTLARVKLVAVTGYGRPVDRARALAAGFEEHVTKPFDLARLTTLIDELARGSTSGPARARTTAKKSPRAGR